MSNRYPSHFRILAAGLLFNTRVSTFRDVHLTSDLPDESDAVPVGRGVKAALMRIVASRASESRVLTIFITCIVEIASPHHAVANKSRTCAGPKTPTLHQVGVEVRKIS
jgi:hypothetical protein